MLRRSCIGTIIGLLLIFWAVSNTHAAAIPLGDNVQITDTGLQDHAAQVKLVAQGDRVYATWAEGSGTGSSILFAISENGGQSWGANQLVSTGSCGYWPRTPDMTVQPDGTIWIVWFLYYRGSGQRSNDLCMARSTDNGQTFEVSNFYQGGNEISDLFRPQIIADPENGRIYILLHLLNAAGDGYDLDLFVRAPETGTWSWVPVSDGSGVGRINSSGQDGGPLTRLVIRDNILCAAWEDVRERYSIYGACSTDGGASFGADFRISESDAVFPRLAIDPDGVLYAAYSISDDARKNIRIRRSADLGATWEAAPDATNITGAVPYAIDWDLAVDEQGVLVLAWALRVNSNVRWVMVSTSQDEGMNWSEAQVHDGSGQYPNTAFRAGVSLATTTGTDGSRAYLAWVDGRNGSPRQIWSARFGLNAEPPTAPDALTATGESKAILLTWNAAAHELGIQGYRIFRATSPEGPWTEINPLLVAGTAYRDIELDGTTYHYRVAAVNTVGSTGPFSNLAAAAAQTAGSSIPEGRLAFVRDGQVILRELAEENEMTLGAGREPLFAADGERLYAIAQRQIGWWPTTGGSFQTFFHHPDNRSLQTFDIAPNNSHFTVLAALTRGQCLAIEPLYGTPDAITYEDTTRIALDITLSPDRQWLVYRNSGTCTAGGLVTLIRHDLCMLRLEDGERTCLGGVGYREPHFSPDGAWLVFAAAHTGQYEIWKARFLPDGSLADYIQLTQGPTGQESSAPRWSTNGEWIVFQRDLASGDGEDFRLFAVQADGQNVTPLNIAGERPALLNSSQTGGPIDPANAALYLPSLQR